jgi:cyclase
MSSIRLIARLDVKAPYLIKTIRFEGLRKLGVPADYARRYYEQGIDEIIYIDAVASLYQRNTIVDLVRETAHDVFVPVTAGGGVRSIEDARILLRAGADKVAVNTAAIHRPALITELARTFGSQCVVISIQAKRHQKDGWEAYCDMGREHTGLDVVAWAREAESLGAGEFLLTSVDREGTRLGFDLELISAVSKAVSIPIIASGGMGTATHLREAVTAGADAIAMAHVLHYGITTIPALRSEARAAGLTVRAA